jgi:hypothetical protein
LAGAILTLSAGGIDRREYIDGLLDTAHGLGPTRLAQNLRAAVMGYPRQFGDDLAAHIEPFRLVPRVRHACGLGIAGSGFRNDPGAAKAAGIPQPFLQAVDVGFAVVKVGLMTLV